LAIGDCGFVDGGLGIENADWRLRLTIADWGLAIADWGVTIADWGVTIADWRLTIAD
jgi:hypothetical protein